MFAGLVEKRLVAIDWDARDLRIVHAAIRKNGFRVLSAHSVTIPEDVSPGDAEAFGRLIRDALAQEGISTRHAVVDIPRDQAVVKMLRGLPPASPEDLPGVIAMQFERELSFPAGEAAIDFSEPIHNVRAKGYEVLVAAVQSDVLARYVRILGAAGLKVERVGLRPHANQVALNALLGDTQHERVLFVDVGPALTEIDVVADGHLVFTRAASVHVPADVSDEPPPVPMPDPGAPEADRSEATAASRPAGRSAASELQTVVRNLVVEVTRSIEAYRADEPGASVTHVVIGGGTGVEEALARALKDRFEVSTELFNPAAAFGWDPDRGAAASGFAAALGLVLSQAGGGGPQFDFLHPKRTVTAAEKQLKKLPVAAAVAVVFLLAGVVGYTKLVKPQRDTLAAIDDDIAAFKAELRANKKFRQRIEKIQEYENQQLVWLDELHDMLELLPDNKEMVVGSIDMDQKNGRIVLDIKAKSRELMTKTVDNLKSYRLPGQDEPHFNADLWATRETRGEYPIVGNIEVTIVGKRPRPDLETPGRG